MIRICCARELSGMAASTVRGKRRILTRRMTALTIERAMNTDQGHARRLVQSAKVSVVGPLNRCMALAAICRKLSAMDVGVAIQALTTRVAEHERRMARDTSDVRVPSHQWILGLRLM